MDAKKRNGELIVSMPLVTPYESSSGKTIVVATSHGRWQSNVKVDGKTVWVVASAYIRLDDSRTKGPGGKISESAPKLKAKKRDSGKD